MNITLFPIAGLILTSTCFFLTFIVIFFGKGILSRVWTLFNICVGLWGIGAFFIGIIKDPTTALIVWRIVHVAIAFIPILMFHVVYLLCNLRSKKFLCFAYIQGIIFSILSITSSLFILKVKYVFDSFYYDVSGPLFYPFFAIWGIIVIYTHFKLLTTYLHSEGRLKNQILYLFVGSGLGFSGGITNFLPAIGINLYPFGNLTIPIYCIIVTYAILMHNLMDIKVIIKKTLIFGSLFTTVYATFAFFAFLGQVFFEKFITTNRWVSMMPSVVAVTIMLRPLENLLINVTDKLLFQKKYDYRKLVKIFTSEVLTVLDLEKLIKLAKDKLTEIMKIESCDVVIGITAADSKLKIPIILHNQSMGTLLLGNKKSDEDYTQEDIDILHPLAKTLGIAISNAKLFEELARTRVEMAQKDKMATIGTLAAGMAHEIRNPMTTIRNFADYLPERYDDKEFMNKFDMLIPKEIDRIENIARSLLEFSSSEGEREDEDFGAKDVIKTVLSLLEPQYRFSGIGVSGDCKGGCVIRANKGTVQDAIFNIMKYIFAEAPKGSNVSINLTETGKSVYISIRNKDLITAEHIIKDVLEPASGLYREKRGFGFDLFVAKQLIERNGGTLNIFSNNRTGSEFRVYFKSASV